MKLDALTIEEMKQGYTFDPDAQCYRCAICGASFEVGEIHRIGSRLLEAAKAVRLHMESEHPDYLHNLICSDSKYNSLTENQKQLFGLFAAGVPDKEIAKELGVSPSTVRHQKFMFREKAKQAKLYLAIYEGAFCKRESGAGIVPIHDNAKMVDERYVVTSQEREHILQTAFSSLSPLRLKAFSPREKKKVVILSRIVEEFQPNRRYSEPEVNALLKEIFEDFATLRRYLIEYGFLQRTQDGSAYWLP